MGTVTLAYPGVRLNGVTARMLGSVLNPPPPVVAVPPPIGAVPLPPPLGAAPAEVDAEIDLFDLDILSVVAMGIWS